MPFGLGWLIAGGAIGALLAPWSIRGGRRATPASGALVQWDERVVSAWRQDPIQAAFIGLHAGAVLSLAVLATMHAWRAPDPWPGGSSLYLGLGVLAGAVLAFAPASRLGPAMPMALYPEGVIRGRFVSDWAAYSHFVPDPALGLIRLFGRRTPEVARVAWHPPTDAAYRAAVEVLLRHLPTSPPARPPWYRRRAAFLAVGVGVTLPPVVAGILVLRVEAQWAPLFYAGMAYLVCLAGILLIRSYQVG